MKRVWQRYLQRGRRCWGRGNLRSDCSAIAASSWAGSSGPGASPAAPLICWYTEQITWMENQKSQCQLAQSLPPGNLNASGSIGWPPGVSHAGRLFWLNCWHGSLILLKILFGFSGHIANFTGRFPTLETLWDSFEPGCSIWFSQEDSLGILPFIYTIFCCSCWKI